MTLGTKTQKNELFNVFIEAAVQAGYDRTDDLNGSVPRLTSHR